MLLGRVKNSHRVIAVLVLIIASLFGLLLLPPIPQDQNYHDFADQRTLLGIPHFWNVVSNIPFIVIGAVGLWPLRRSPAIVILFLGILLTGFGSAYYHLDPDDSTLFWDRLPMAVSFMMTTRAGANAKFGRKLPKNVFARNCCPKAMNKAHQPNARRPPRKERLVSMRNTS